MNSRFTATDPEGIRCSDSWRMDFTFEEEAGGTLDGEGTATLVSGPDCNFEFTAPSRTFTYAVEGERVANTFSIRFAWRSGTVGVGFAAMFPIPNPVSSPVVIVTAAGRGFTGHQWELQHPGGTYTVDTPKIELFCPSCEPGN